MKLFEPHIRRYTVSLCVLILSMFAVPGSVEENVVTLYGDAWRWTSDDMIHASGDIQASYRDFKITADSVDTDLQTNVAVFQGNVRLATQEHTVEGERLTLNLKTRDWIVDDASSKVDLSTLERSATGPAFIRSGSLSGDEKHLKLTCGALTTCDLDHPHYYFSAEELQIYPDNKIVARKVSIVGLDRRLLSLDSLVIPIRGFRHNLLPQIGSSAEEGMFLKTSYAYMATESAQGFLKLDLMQKRGVGAGIEHRYNIGVGSGQATIYYLADQAMGNSNITGSIRHQQQLGSINMNVTGDYRTNNYLYYPASTSQNWQMGFSHVEPNSNTALTFRGNATRGVSRYESQTSSLRHTQVFNNNLRGVLSMDMRRYLSGGMTAADRELDSVLELRQRNDKFDLSLIASKKFDLNDDDEDSVSSFRSSIDRLPELTFETDSYRSGVNLLGVPYRLSLSAGRYHEMPSDIASDRLLLQWDMQGHRIDLGSRSDLNVTAGYRQAYYGADSMQYVLRANSVMTSRINDHLRARVTYNYQNSDGFSPFRFDYTGRYNYARAVMDYQDSNRLRWSLSGGYDFSRGTNPWQDLSLRLTARPSSEYGFSLSTGYDLNRSRWRSLISQFQVSLPERLSLDVGTRYNIQTGKVELARGRMDYRIDDNWRLEGISSWNGLTRKFDYRSFRLTRDLHCWEASLVYNDETGFRNDKELRLEMRIKAFPSVDRFGIGQYGQTMDTSMGQYYY